MLMGVWGLPIPITIVSVVIPIFPLVVHQSGTPSIQRGMSTNPGVTTWYVCGCS